MNLSSLVRLSATGILKEDLEVDPLFEKSEYGDIQLIQLSIRVLSEKPVRRSLKVKIS